MTYSNYVHLIESLSSKPTRLEFVEFLARHGFEIDGTVFSYVYILCSDGYLEE